MQVHGLNSLFRGVHKEHAPIGYFRDCAIDRVETAVKCIVALFWGGGGHFQHGGKFVPRNSLTMHFEKPSRTRLSCNLNWWVSSMLQFNEIFTLEDHSPSHLSKNLGICW